MSSYRTPLSRARGHGAAREGAHHWLAERLSAVAMAPLVLWGVFGVIHLAAGDYQTAADWISQVQNLVLMILLLVVGFWHMHAGMRVIVEDYIQKTFSRVSLLILNLFVCVLAGSLAIFSLIRVALLGGAL